MVVIAPAARQSTLVTTRMKIIVDGPIARWVNRAIRHRFRACFGRHADGGAADDTAEHDHCSGEIRALHYHLNFLRGGNVCGRSTPSHGLGSARVRTYLRVRLREVERASANLVHTTQSPPAITADIRTGGEAEGFGGEADERGVNGRGRRRSIPGASNISGRRSDVASMDSNLTSQPIRARLCETSPGEDHSDTEAAKKKNNWPTKR